MLDFVVIAVAVIAAVGYLIYKQSPAKMEADVIDLVTPAVNAAEKVKDEVEKL